MIRALAFAAAFILVLAVSVFAQQPPPDPVLMQKTIEALQTQRNEASDWRAALTARLSQAMDENAKLQARIKELEAKLPKPEAEPHP